MFDGNGACAMDSCLHLADGGGSLWAAEPTSSKDTVSRINSPRNSKSSGTAVRSCDKDNSTDRDLDAVSSRSDQDEQHTPTKSERSGSPMRDALEDISNVLSTTQQESPLGSSIRERSPSSPAAKQASRSPSASQQGAFSNSGAAAERDAVAAEVESRVVSPPEESPEGAACPEALRSGEACEGHSNPELGSSDSFLLSPSNAKPRSKARGSRRPRALAPEMADNAAQKAPRSPVKSEWTPKEQPLEVLLPGLDSTLTARLAEPAELCVLATPAQCEPPLLPCAEVIEDRGDMVLPSASARALMEAESLSRAASAVPGADLPEGEGGSNDGREEGEAEEVVPRRQRASRAKRKPPLSGRRGSRASGLDDNALGAASDDEDYCPPGDADEVAAPKRQRLLRMRTSAPVLSIPEAGTTRGQSRLRWSNTTGCIATPPPLGSPSGGSRRLRSQPVDLTDLRPDAFAFSPPKRGRTSQLQAAVANLEHLRSMEGTKLARSSASGICKPYPLWLGPLDSQLQACSEAARDEAISRHASDRQLLHGPRPPPPSRTEASHRLGRSPLGKALLQTGEPQVSLEHPDQLLPACRSLFPPFLEPGLAYWEARLLTPCQGAYGETTTCARARKDRDLHNTWEDLQARHTAEAASLEAFHKWLLPTVDTPDE